MASTTNSSTNSGGSGGLVNKPPPQITSTTTAAATTAAAALNPVTLSKALAKPPPLSSILNKSPNLTTQNGPTSNISSSSSSNTNGPTSTSHQLPVASVALNGPTIGHANGLGSIVATTSHLFDHSTASTTTTTGRVPTPQQLLQQQQPPSKISPIPSMQQQSIPPNQQQQTQPGSQSAQIQTTPTIQPPITNMPSAQSLFPPQQQQQQQQQQQPSPFQAPSSMPTSYQPVSAPQPVQSSQIPSSVRPPMFQPPIIPQQQQQQQQQQQIPPPPSSQNFVGPQQTQFTPTPTPPQSFNRPPLANLPPQHTTAQPPPPPPPTTTANMPPRFAPPAAQPPTSIPPTSLTQIQQQQQQQFAQSQGGMMPPQMMMASGPPLTRPPPPGQQQPPQQMPPQQPPLSNGPNMTTAYSAQAPPLGPPLGPPLSTNLQQNYPPMSQEHFSTAQQQQQQQHHLHQQQQLSGPPLPQSYQQQQQQQPPLGPPPPTQPGINRAPPLTQPMVPNGPSSSSMPYPQQQQLINQFQSNMNISQPQPRPNANMPPQMQQQMPPPQPQQQQQPHITQNMLLNQSRSQPQAIDLQRERRLFMPFADDTPPRPIFPQEFYNNVNCHYDTMRCTLTSIPESQNLLNKCRLPLGLLIHPFKDLESLKVVQSSTIVRCRNCRTYINPFVQFLDSTKWRCNMCYSINDLPEEFLFDPVTKTYGDPTKRPEINSSTIEFIAPPEYTLRPPPPAMYLYLLDVSHNAINTGYLRTFCETLLENLDKIPGDARTQIGFITYNSCIHFYNLSEALSQPRMMIYADIGDASDSDSLTLPMPDGLMVNLSENRESIQMFLQALPGLFSATNPSACVETDSALGTALTAAFQLLKPTGGRISVMQTCLPNMGEGALKTREETIEKDSSNLSPQIDFYKKMALECAGVHIAVDLFMFNSLYSDLPTLSCISKYSGGEIKYYPRYHPDETPEQVIRFSADFKRYLTRKIGFEAVMRLRCTRGLSIHTFHGNFFVRSTDLLALPNVSPDSGFGMQLTIDEPLTDLSTVSLQAAVLYTSSKGERRIRIHTYCLPVTRSVHELVNGADQEAIIGLVAKMAVDRTAMNSLREARDALVNVAIDYLAAYKQHMTSHTPGALITPYALRCIPLYVLALLKNVAFRFSNSRMDDRIYAMNVFKTLPLRYLMLFIYPDLYALHNFDDTKVVTDSYEAEVCVPPRLHLSSENIDRHGVYLLDAGESIYMWVGKSVSDLFLQDVFGCKSFNELPEFLYDLPEIENPLLDRIRTFLAYLIDNRPFGVTFICFKEGSPRAKTFFQHMYEDKSESAFSYYELLRHLSEHVKS